MPTYTLHYFDIYARAEPLRCLLAHAGADWKDNRFGFDAWGALKPTMPGQQVPCLELADGTKMGQSTAILRYIGAKHGYYPNDPWLASKCDEYIEAAQDVYNEIAKPHFASENDRPALMEKYFGAGGLMPTFCKALDSDFAKGQFLCGDKLTCADFMVGNLYVSLATNAGAYGRDAWAGLLTQFPNFKAYGERYRAANSAWLSKREARPI